MFHICVQFSLIKNHNSLICSWLERLKWTGNIKFEKRRLIFFSRKFHNKADYFGSEILKVPDFNLSNFEHFEMLYFKWFIITFQNIPWYFLSCARCCTNRNIYFGQSRTVKSWFHKKGLSRLAYQNYIDTDCLLYWEYLSNFYLDDL